MRLKDDAVPRIFDFPEHLRPKVAKKRSSPRKRTVYELGEPSCSKTETKVPKLGSYPSKDDLISLVKLQQVKIKTLQQKVRRKENKIKSLNGYIDTLSKDKLVSPVVADQLKDTFSGFTSDIIVTT